MPLLPAEQSLKLLYQAQLLELLNDISRKQVVLELIGKAVQVNTSFCNDLRLCLQDILNWLICANMEGLGPSVAIAELVTDDHVEIIPHNFFSFRFLYMLSPQKGRDSHLP